MSSPSYPDVDLTKGEATMTMSLIDRARVLTGGVPLGELLERLAAVRGDSVLVEQPTPITLADGATSLTYREAATIVARASEVLAPRCHGGRRIVIRGPNDYGFFLACLAVSRAGGVIVPLNPRMPEPEVEYVAADADADVLDVEALDVELRAATVDGGAPARPVSDVAGIFYTSGTTGHPKGARLSHEALVEPASWTVLWPARMRRDEIVVSLPIAHIMGFAALVGAAGAGSAVYFIPKFSPSAVLDALERRRATGFVGVPSMFRMMLEAGAEGRDLRSVRIWISGADVMPPDLARRFKRMGATVTLPVLGRSIGEALFVQGYGMVELGGGASAKVSPPGVSWGLGDFIGVSLLGRHMRVVDAEGNDASPGEVGELVVKTRSALRGYHGDPGKTAEVLTEEGWVRTGDLARRDRWGIIHFVGREKDVLMRGGYSVFPAEIEAVLRDHPAVSDVAVVGRPDEVMGEVPVAFVRLEPGRSATAEEILAFGEDRLASYKVPVEVRFLDTLPRSGTGKVSKSDLRGQL